MCKVFQISRSCYYLWAKKGCITKKVDETMDNLIQISFEHSLATYGTRRLKHLLVQKYGLIVPRRKIQNIMKYLNLKVKMKR
jgi:putative transposase